MKLRYPASVLGLALVCGTLLPGAARASRPAGATQHQLTFEEAEMLVLVTQPVLADFADGAPVLSRPLGMAIVGGDSEYVVEVSEPSGKALGFYHVDSRTARVHGADGHELHGAQLDAAQRIVREARGIAITMSATARR